MKQTFIVGIDTEYKDFNEWIEEHDKQIRADVIEEALSKVRNLVNTECNPSCECQPDCLYLAALGDAVGILNQLKEQK